MTLISHDRHCFILDCGTSGVISQKNTLLSEHNVRITSIEECRLLCPGFEAVQPEKSANFISTRKTLICRRVKIRTPYIERCPQLTFYSPVCSQYIYNWNTQISLCPQYALQCNIMYGFTCAKYGVKYAWSSLHAHNESTAEACIALDMSSSGMWHGSKWAHCVIDYAQVCLSKTAPNISMHRPAQVKVVPNNLCKILHKQILSASEYAQACTSKSCLSTVYAQAYTSKICPQLSMHRPAQSKSVPSCLCRGLHKRNLSSNDYAQACSIKRCLPTVFAQACTSEICPQMSMHRPAQAKSVLKCLYTGLHKRNLSSNDYAQACSSKRCLPTVFAQACTSEICPQMSMHRPAQAKAVPNYEQTCINKHSTLQNIDRPECSKYIVN